MSSTFPGFSEDDLKRIKSGGTESNSAPQINTPHAKKLDKIGTRPRRVVNQYKLPVLQKQDSDDAIENLFDKCKLSIKTPTSPPDDTFNNNNNEDIQVDNSQDDNINTLNHEENVDNEVNDNPDSEVDENNKNISTMEENRKSSTGVAPDILRCVDNYTEDELSAHRAKLQGLQLKQKLMEEQNKKRKEMLAKALADRTKQTAEEVQRLEKIKKELQVLDGQFSQDVAVLRKKIDLACISYADAEKHYLKVEKDFLQAKIQLQKEKERKELLTEHLCALITHNETRKAQKLEKLMLELASDKKTEMNYKSATEDDERTVIVDGVDEITGKIVEFTES